MARQSNCAILLQGQDAGCVPLVRKFYQQAVIINKADIDPDSIVITKTDFESAQFPKHEHHAVHNANSVVACAIKFLPA